MFLGIRYIVWLQVLFFLGFDNKNNGLEFKKENFTPIKWKIKSVLIRNRKYLLHKTAHHVLHFRDVTGKDREMLLNSSKIESSWMIQH